MSSDRHNSDARANQVRWAMVLVICGAGICLLFLVGIVFKKSWRGEPDLPSRAKRVIAPEVLRTPLQHDAKAVPEKDATAGQVSGKVFLQGVPPPEMPITLNAECRESGQGPKTTRHYSVGSSGGLADVLVYIKSGLETRTFSTPREEKEVEIVDCRIDPYVFGIQTNQKLKLINRDSMLHSFRAQDGPRVLFNVGVRPQEPVSDRSFSGSSIFIPLKCSRHPWEVAHAGVVPHPFFAVTDANGNFKLPRDLPPGKYIIAAKHPKAGEVTQELTIGPNTKERIVVLTFIIKNDPPSERASTTIGDGAGDSARSKNSAAMGRSAASAIPSTGALSPRTIRGRVLLKGTPPLEKTIEMDAICGKLHETEITTRHFVMGEDHGLGNVFVYISKGLENKKFPIPKQEVVLDQVGCVYQPYVLGVMKNQPLKIRNSDPFLHNVHSMPRSENKEFNFGQPTQGQVTEKTFDFSEVLMKLKCEVHNWMFAYVGVVDHPFFGVTDQNGFFQLPSNLPPGKYTLLAVHQKAGELAQPLTLRNQESLEVKFEFLLSPAQ